MNTADIRKRIIKLLIRIAVTSILLTWVCGKINLQQFVQDIKTARWEYLIALWILTVGLFWLRSIRMRMILKQQGCDVTNARIFAASAVTCLYSLIIPGILSTGAKWYILKKDTGKGAKVLSSMVYNQLSTMIVLMIFGLGTLAVTNPFALIFPDIKSRYLWPVVCWILLVIVFLISVLLLSERVGGQIIKGMSFVLKPLPESIRKKGMDTLKQISLFQTAGVRFHLIIAVLVVITGIGGGVLTFIVTAKGANITNVPVVTYIWLWALIFITGRIPVSIANIGPREAILVVSLSAYGVEESSAFLMSIIYFSALIFMALIGAAYQIYWAETARKSA